MDPFFIKAAQLLLSLSILIVLHEGGHFAAAKLFNTKVEKFFLFFDVKFAFFKKKIGDTVYGIGWLPLGGYVKIAGMIDESMDKEQMAKPPQPWEFRSKPAWQRLIIMLGGVTVNMILGFVIFMMILFVWGKDYVSEASLPQGFAVSQHMEDLGFRDGDVILAVDGEPLDNMLNINKYLLVRDINSVKAKHADGTVEQIAIPEDIGSTLFQSGEMRAFSVMPSRVIDSVVPNSPAALAGLTPGDKLISVNGQQLKNYMGLNLAKKENPDAALTLGVLNNNQKRTVTVTPNDKNNIGIYAKVNFFPKHKNFGLGESITHGFSYTYWTLHDYVAQFEYVFTKKGATKLGGFGAIGSM